MTAPRPRNDTEIQIDVTERELGMASYTCTRYYNYYNLEEDQLEQIRECYSNEGEEAAEELLREIVANNIHNSDPNDWENYEYSEEQSEDVDNYQDDTDYSSIIQELTE